MDDKCRHIISKFLNRLKRRVDLKWIRPLVEKRKIFTKSMLDDVYDPSNDNDLFYDLLCTRGPYAFSKFINILFQTGHKEEVLLLQNEYLKDYTPVPYKMTSVPIGFCLIIINEKKDKLPSQLGAKANGSALEHLFNTLGFAVKIEWNLKGEEMKNCLLLFSQNPKLSQTDSIVVFIICHGDRIKNRDVLLGTNADPVYISEIYTMFDNNNCPMLLGKPKIFFFHACRGNPKKTGNYETKYVLHKEQTRQDISDVVTIVNRPSMIDMIIVHSTLPYHLAFLDKEEGSWLCQDVVKVFSVNYLRHDLETMLKSVCEKMRKRISSFNIKQAIHVELLGVRGIVKFGHYN